MSSGWSDPRPLSPFTSVWRWHVTMLTSILHRAAGVALFAGVFVLVAWLAAAAEGQQTYEKLMHIMASWPGRLVLFGFTLALCFHLLNGVRYLLWDSGHGFEKGMANRTAWIAILLSLVLTIAIWVTAYWGLDLLPNQLQGAG